MDVCSTCSELANKLVSLHAAQMEFSQEKYQWNSSAYLPGYVHRGREAAGCIQLSESKALGWEDRLQPVLSSQPYTHHRKGQGTLLISPQAAEDFYNKKIAVMEQHND